ncbi:TetR family transcriptional regulator [Salipiger pallidus]|uniref:TetR family transcriptional regulator n=1 Tax=Salipiger pallidus TaxID=1775170 RepID=A0A8J2ZMH5_9RHOB|nr:TetR/AcrR family transcriptional regulator [Salipiger pallidus]GGG83752.1 TetR family transcriptional regulator [Salipiger pallidus]
MANEGIHREWASRIRGHEESGHLVESVVEILDCAALCFTEMGFQGTSIDDVARRLGATKGRIYHYFRSKTDLFFEVHREGMTRLMDAVTAAMDAGGTGREKLQRMVEAHALTMMQNVAYEAVVVQGVHLHRLSATTPEQRVILNELMDVRHQFEQLFVQVFHEGQADGSVRETADTSLAVKGILGAVNWMAIWYRPRADESPETQKAMAVEVAGLQIKGVT